MKPNKSTKPLWADPKSITGRLFIASMLWVVFALGLGGVLLSAAFRSHVEDEMDERLQLTMDSMIGISDIDESGNIYFIRPLSEQRFNEPYSGWYWQISAEDAEQYRSRSLWDQELEVDLEQHAFPRKIFEGEGPEGQIIRVLERDILLPGTEKSFHFQVAGDISETRVHIAGFNRIIVWSLGALGLGIIIAMIFQVTFGLAPLRGVKTGLSAIRSGTRKRLAGDCPPEIKPLVEEMNAVLAQNETLVERAQVQMGNLAHSLKTPLAVISNEIEGHKNSKLAKIMEKQSNIIRRHVDYQLARARAVGHSRHVKTNIEVEVSLINVGRTIQRIYKDRNLALQVEIEPGLKFKGEKRDLEEILGNLLDNAAKWAKSKIQVTAKSKKAKSKSPTFTLTIEDDGPGVDRAQRPSLYKRGKRLDEGVPGSGLGLAIVRDISQVYGGKIHLKRSSLGGLKVEVVLPAGEK